MNHRTIAIPRSIAVALAMAVLFLAALEVNHLLRGDATDFTEFGIEHINRPVTWPKDKVYVGHQRLFGYGPERTVVHVTLDGITVGTLITPFYDPWRHLGLGDSRWYVDFDIEEPGTRFIQAHAYNLVGELVASSEILTVTAIGMLPPKLVDAVLDEASGAVRITGTCTQSSAVQVKLDGDVLGDGAFCDQYGQWSVTSIPQHPVDHRDHRIALTAYHTGGEEQSQEVETVIRFK